jgi:hypothetical protein
MHPSSHTSHHDSALLYSDLDLGFDVAENGMVYNAPLNMLADHNETHFDFGITNIKQEEDDSRPLSPTSLNDDMEVTSSPVTSDSSSSSSSSILDQLTHGNNNNNNNHVIPHPHTGYWNYAQHATRVVNPMMPSYVTQPQQFIYTPGMYVPEIVPYSTQPVGYTFVENPYPMPHLVSVVHQYVSPVPCMTRTSPTPQRHERSSPDNDEEELLEMNDEEFHNYVAKYCSCDTEAFEELNSRRNKVIDELKSLEQELQKTRDEALKSYDQLLGNAFDERTKNEKMSIVREKVEGSIQEVRKHAEAKLRQMVSSAHRKRQNRKLPDRATSILQQWFLENAKYPYPGVEEKARLQRETQLTLTQINNWFINKRGRALKPIREKIVQQSGSRSK